MTDPSLTEMNEICNLVATQTGDMMRQLMQAAVQKLMAAEVDNRCGAASGERTEERANQRNGYRSRPWGTRLGSVELKVPKLRQGVYYPEWLLQRRRRAEQALA